MVLSLFVSVMMLVLLHSLESRDTCLTLWRGLGDLGGSDEGKILPEITEEEGPVFLWEAGGDGWQETK